MKAKYKAFSLVLAIAASGTLNADLLFGPVSYKAGYQPFSGTSFSYWYLENFDNGLKPGAGVLEPSSGYALPPSPETDSVNGPDTWSYYPKAESVTFTFDPNSPSLNGKLPTHAGIVWTDTGFNLQNQAVYSGNVRFEAFDKNGKSLGVIGPVREGDGKSTLPNTSEDVFFGIIHLAGISAITISTENSTDWEVDDLQFGIANVDAGGGNSGGGSSGGGSGGGGQIPTPTPPDPTPITPSDPNTPAAPACTDTAKPSIRLAKPFNKKGVSIRNPVEISGSVTEDCSLSSVKIFVKNDLVSFSNSNEIRYTLNPARWKNGRYPLIVTAEDTAGNVVTKRILARIRLSKARRAQLTNQP